MVLTINVRRRGGIYLRREPKKEKSVEPDRTDCGR
jgi:hypothetical protein